MTKITIEKSKRGIPCLWECGGGMSNTGDSRIIVDRHGEAKKAIYVRSRGQLSCSYHALIPVAVGDYIIMANHHRKDFNVYVYRVESINLEEEFLEAKLINTFSQNEWEQDLDFFLEKPVEASMNKASCYHCRTPHYIAD